MYPLHPSLQQILMAQIQSVIEKFPSTEFFWPHRGQAYIEYRAETTSGTRYTLRLFFDPEYPEQCPALFMWIPRELSMDDGDLLNDEETSHDFHTLENGFGGRIQICHMHPRNWDASISFILPMIKGALWCEAYELYMDEGGCIADYLKEDEEF